jgi:hypothetical protein
MVGSGSRLAILVCTILAVTCWAACDSREPSSAVTGAGDGTTTTTRSPEVQKLADGYSVVAEETNLRISVLKSFAAQDSNTAEEQSTLDAWAVIIRDFDTKISQLAIPTGRLQSDVQAVVDADEQIAQGLEQMAHSTSCAQSCSAYARMAPYYEKRTAALVRLRAALGLPPSQGPDGDPSPPP